VPEPHDTSTTKQVKRKRLAVKLVKEKSASARAACSYLTRDAMAIAEHPRRARTMSFSIRSAMKSRAPTKASLIDRIAEGSLSVQF